MPDYMQAAAAIAEFCDARGLNSGIVLHAVRTGYAVRYLREAGIPDADIASVAPAARQYLAAHLPPREPKETWPAPAPTASAAPEPDLWAETNRRTGIITCLEAQRRQGFARYLADHTNLTVDQARGALALVPCEPLPVWGAGPEPVAVVRVRPDQAAHPGSQAGIDDVWARAVAAVNRGG